MGSNQGFRDKLARQSALHLESHHARRHFTHHAVFLRGSPDVAASREKLSVNRGFVAHRRLRHPPQTASLPQCGPLKQQGTGVESDGSSIAGGTCPLPCRASLPRCGPTRYSLCYR